MFEQEFFDIVTRELDFGVTGAASDEAAARLAGHLAENASSKLEYVEQGLRYVEFFGEHAEQELAKLEDQIDEALIRSDATDGQGYPDTLWDVVFAIKDLIQKSGHVDVDKFRQLLEEDWEETQRTQAGVL